MPNFRHPERHHESNLDEQRAREGTTRQLESTFHVQSTAINALAHLEVVLYAQKVPVISAGANLDAEAVKTRERRRSRQLTVLAAL